MKSPEDRLHAPDSSPPASAAGDAPWHAELASLLEGEVDVSPLAVRLYSQDASIYEERPLGVARPKSGDDCRELVQLALRRGVPLLPRAGGTSLAGQCVGKGLVVDVSRHMTRILEIDPAGRRARVEPGVIQDDLNDAARRHGLTFAPDTSTSRQAAIGGMIGNNSCGAYSILHGTTREHTIEVDAVLGDGSRARFGPLSPQGLEERKQGDRLEARIYREIFRLIEENRDIISREFPGPRVKRRNMGYALDVLASFRPWNPEGRPFNLAALFCGSEGTLGLVTEAVVNLVRLPEAKLLVAAHFASVDEACRATVSALEHAPAAVELLDGVVLEATRQNREQAGNRFWVEGSPGAVLLIEFHGSRAEELRERASALTAAFRSRGLGYAWASIQEKDLPRVWALRKAGLGLLTGIPGDRKPVTAIEDTAVPPESLPEYVREIRHLMEKHGCNCVYYGHASVGCLHLRPMLNLKDAGDLRKFEAILEETAGIVKRYGGSLSGEHGDGRLRGPFLRRMFSPKVCDLFLRVKQLFDPQGIFNPGKIVDAPPVTECLRAHPGSRTPEVETVFDWSRQEGLVRATEACSGAGFCRQGAGRGTMCPSYMATGEEAFSTRGRANVLRQLLTSEDPDRAWTNPELAAVMDTCLSCKGCAAECPSNVDMARLKAEVLQKRMDREGIPLRSFLMGHYARFARLARAAPRMASWWINLAWVKRFLGIAVEREVPAYASRTLVGWFRSRAGGKPPALQGEPSLRGEVFLLADEFTNYSEPEVGIAAVEFLEAAGFRVHLPASIDSGRTQISKGFLRSARKRMTRAVEALHPWAERGIPIVGIEPSALLGFRDEAPDLVPPSLRARAEKVQASCLLFEEFVARKAGEGALELLAFPPAQPVKVLLHGHCQQKAIAGTSCTVAALRLVPGLDVVEIPSGCCGMAGSFGYEKEHYELSLRIAELVLFPAIRAEPDAILCAPGTSCRHQIADGTGRKAFHPAQILRAALDPGSWADLRRGRP